MSAETKNAEYLAHCAGYTVLNFESYGQPLDVTKEEAIAELNTRYAKIFSSIPADFPRVSMEILARIMDYSPKFERVSTCEGASGRQSFGSGGYSAAYRTSGEVEEVAEQNASTSFVNKSITTFALAPGAAVHCRATDSIGKGRTFANIVYYNPAS